MTGWRTLFFLIVAWWCSFATSDSYRHRHYRAIQQTSHTLRGNAIPVLRLLKRVVRNFREGYVARVTLVFKATTDVQVRWFRQQDSEWADESEVPNMLPVEGNPLYSLSEMTSGYLIATTLSVPAFKEMFPVELETIITTLDGTMQYQLTTIIASERDLSPVPEDIYSPQWLAIPPPIWTFYRHRSFHINCKILVSDEKDDFTNEMVLFRAYKNINSPNGLIEIDKLFEVHKNLQYQLEDQGQNKFQRERLQLADKSVLYEVNMTATNASGDLEGVYQCVFEREHEKTYVISQLAVVGHRSAFPSKPRVAFQSCSSKNQHGFTVELVQGTDTCLRCRGFGHPRPEVALYRGEREEVTSSQSMSVSKFVSVADAGLVEATYTFHGVNMHYRGNYTCRAFNSNGHSETPVSIVVSQA